MAHDNVKPLAHEFIANVRARRTLGDARAVYHAQKPKVEAYRRLIDKGLSPRSAVAVFEIILRQLGAEDCLADKEGPA